MKIVFIYPQVDYYVLGEKLHNDPSAPPLGILYLSAILENMGHSVEVIDYAAQNLFHHQLASTIRSADVVGITVLSPEYENSIQLSKMIKEIDPQIPLIIGGPHCSLYPERSLTDMNADASIVGDGELIIADIINAIEKHKSLSKIPGVYCRQKNKIQSGPPAEINKNLDSIHFPARHLVKKYSYGKVYIPDAKKGEFTSIMTTRGCPMHCSFCTRQFIGMKTFRKRSSKNVINELKEIYNNGYKYVMFADDNFLADKKRAVQIMDGIINENIDLSYYIQGARVDSVDENLFQKMKKAGVKGISFGIESGNQDVLDFYKKGITLGQIRKAVELSNQMGFNTQGTLILGAPFETKQHFEKTIRFANSLPLDVGIYYSLDYRTGSELWKNAVKEGKIDPNEYWVPCGSERGLGLYPRGEVDAYCKKATLRFYLRPSYVYNQVKKTIKTRQFESIKSLLRHFSYNFTKILFHKN